VNKRLWDEMDEALGFNDDRMNRDRPYSGQPWTDSGERGKTEIKGVTFRDLRDCFIRAICLSTGANANGAFGNQLYQQAVKGEEALICENDLYKLDLNKIDIMAVCQNLSCEMERLMGIFPNLPKES
jgi:hypothetical protein